MDASPKPDGICNPVRNVLCVEGYRLVRTKRKRRGCKPLRAQGIEGICSVPSSRFTAIKLSQIVGAAPSRRLGSMGHVPRLSYRREGAAPTKPYAANLLNSMAVKLRFGNPYLASTCLAVLREAGASKTPMHYKQDTEYRFVGAGSKPARFCSK